MKRNRHNRGQATAEFAIGLVGLIVVFLGMVQIGAIGNASVKTYQEAREDADRNSQGNLGSLTADYVPDWANGPDGMRYTIDDTLETRGIVLRDDSTDAYSRELGPGALIPYFEAHPGIIVEDHFVSAMSGSLSSATDLYMGDSDDWVKLDKALQRLIYAHGDYIHVRDEVVMPGLSLRTSTGNQGP